MDQQQNSQPNIPQQPQPSIQPEMPQKQKSPTLMIVLITVLVIVVIGGGGYAAYQYYFEPEPVACTEEAKICPDGSSVGRIAPDCEFAKCPEVVDPTADWQTYTNEEYGFEVKYPEGWIFKEATKEEFLKYGILVHLQSPSTIELIQQEKVNPDYIYDLAISYWTDINNETAKGGSWLGQWIYKDLKDYFTDQNNMKTRIGKIVIDNQEAYEVIIGGYSSNYGVMVEYNGIYELSFQRISQPGYIEKQILSTFKFIIVLPEEHCFNNGGEFSERNEEPFCVFSDEKECGEFGFNKCVESKGNWQPTPAPPSGID